MSFSIKHTVNLILTVLSVIFIHEILYQGLVDVMLFYLVFRKKNCFLTALSGEKSNGMICFVLITLD